MGILVHFDELVHMVSFTKVNKSVSYEFGPNRGIITYTFPEDNRPEMQEDTIAIGFITTKSDAVLLRIVSGTSNDYIEMYIVEGNVFAVYNLGTNDLPLGDISVKVNDNSYHVVRFHRQGHNSTLQIDDYNVQTSHPSGHQLQVFNSQSQIQIGGKWTRKGRIERAFTGVISGVVVNGLRILDLAAEKDIHASIRGDVQLISGIFDRHDHLQKMQQTTASEFPGVQDDLVFSGAGSGCNGDDEDECPPLPENGSGDDDLITPVYVPPTRPPATPKPSKKNNSREEEKLCDDEDCTVGSGSGEITEEPSTSKTTDLIFTPTADNTSSKTTDEGSTSSGHQTTTLDLSTAVTAVINETEDGTTSLQQHLSKIDTTTLYIPMEETTTATTEKYVIPSVHQQNKPRPIDFHDYHPQIPASKPPERVSSERSETIALIIGIIAGALIAVILIILVILKFKSRDDRSFKVDDGKGYQQGPNAALLGSASATNGQTQFQVNGALRNGDKGLMQKAKKRDSKDIKEWYV
ncbi:hypothetical protein NQ318_018615 [Aromia moschata]|uniref:Laminin G domain-containing protein n=1 Tax=Aromia moschata TaxID=1265417 RepID=A0AAV8ZGP8_9CUCU|nr:hypothetical protein NQ318_018615 [Aromia moschata]